MTRKESIARYALLPPYVDQKSQVLVHPVVCFLTNLGSAVLKRSVDKVLSKLSEGVYSEPDIASGRELPLYMIAEDAKVHPGDYYPSLLYMLQKLTSYYSQRYGRTKERRPDLLR